MYMLKELVDLQDKSNEILVKHIGFIYDIINFNNLKRPAPFTIRIAELHLYLKRMNRNL